MGMMKYFWMLLTVLLCADVFDAADAAAEIVKLTDETFDSRTGRWLILFHDYVDYDRAQIVLMGKGDTREKSLAGILAEEGIKVATMHVSSNPETVERLQIPETPYAVLLVNKLFYRASNWDNIRDFALSGYLYQHAEVIPPPPAKAESIFEKKNNTHMIAFVLGSIFMVALAYVGFKALKFVDAQQHKKKD